MNYRLVILAALALVILGGIQTRSQQEMYTHGQDISPAFEGWEENPDGTFSMVFGYFNRNWVEQPDVPVGPNNSVEPGGPDQGQPTHFFPRRNRFVFRVRVPKDFGKKEVVWTLTVNGKTERAYATLHPAFVLDDRMIQRENSGTSPAGIDQNRPPSVRIDGDTRRRVKTGEPLDLAAHVTDDGLLKLRASPRVPQGFEPGYHPARGLRVAWYVYRGPADKVAFEPEQFKIYPDLKGNSPFAPGWLPPPVPPEGGKFSARATFAAPGEYVLQVMANDGGYGVTDSVTVTVDGPPLNPATSANR